MHILTIYCNKNLITATVFTAGPEPEFVLAARLSIDKYTGFFAAKVYDEANFRHINAPGLPCVPVEKHRQPDGTWADAVTWLESWLARQGFNVVQTVLRRQVFGDAAFNAVTDRFSGWDSGFENSAFILALHGWVVYASRDMDGEERKRFWRDWQRPSLSKVSVGQLKKLESWAFYILWP